MTTVDEMLRLHNQVQQDIARLTAGKEAFLKTNLNAKGRLFERRRDLDRQLADLEAERKSVVEETATKIRRLTETVATERQALIRRVSLASLRDHWPPEFVDGSTLWWRIPPLETTVLYDDHLIQVVAEISNDTSRLKNNIKLTVRMKVCKGFVQIVDGLVKDRTLWHDTFATRHFPLLDEAKQFRDRNGLRLAEEYIQKFTALREECLAVTEPVDALFDFRLLLEETFTRNHSYDNHYRVVSKEKHVLVVDRLHWIGDDVEARITVRFQNGRLAFEGADEQDVEQITGFFRNEFHLLLEVAA